MNGEYQCYYVLYFKLSLSRTVVAHHYLPKELSSPAVVSTACIRSSRNTNWLAPSTLCLHHRAARAAQALEILLLLLLLQCATAAHAAACMLLLQSHDRCKNTLSQLCL
jgi:hypothetical protein